MKVSSILRIAFIGILLTSLFWGEETPNPEPDPAPKDQTEKIEDLPSVLVGDYVAYVMFKDHDPNKPVKLETPLPMFTTSETGLTLAGAKAEKKFTYLGERQLDERVWAFKLAYGAESYFVVVTSPDWGGQAFLQECKTDTEEILNFYAIAIVVPETVEQ